MRALAATDGTETALHAVRVAVELCKPGLTLTIVHVVPAVVDPLAMASGFAGPLVIPSINDRLNEEVMRAGQEALEHTAAAVAEIESEVELVRGADAGSAIIAMAEERDVDLIVLGETEHGWFRRLVSGSVMHHVVSHAHCPVLVVPGHS